MKKALIIGYGYVGKAFAEMIDGRMDITICDPNIDSSADLKYAWVRNLKSKAIAETKFDLAVICVPTPSSKYEMGACDTSIVSNSIREVKADVILIKSTIAPGTTDDLISETKKDIVFSPEYVGEGNYYMAPPFDFQTDMKKTPFLILGGEESACNKVLDLLVPVLGPSKHYYKCSAKEAEVIKYMENTYFGVKITFAQEMYDICEAMGVDWYKVWEGWALDPRVDRMHTAVFPGSRGFSGKCLPKDINALVASSIEHGFTPHFLVAMLKKNARLRDDEPVRIDLDDLEEE